MLNDWVFIDFDNILGAPLDNPIDFFYPCKYQCCPLSADPNVVDKKFQPYKKAALVNIWSAPSFIDLQFYDAIFVVNPEITWQPIKQYLEKLRLRFNNKNIFLITSSVATNNDHEDLFIFPWWLPNTAKLNTFTSPTYLPKSKIFDALLGLNRPHRQFIYDNLIQHGLENKCLISLLKRDWENDKFPESNSYLYRSSELDQYESADAKLSIQKNSYFHSGEHCFNGGHGVSRQVPWAIYNETYHSIVAETSYDNNFPFFTEKTAKPLVAGRLFVLFGPQGQLDMLRSYGFKTFGNVVDETYDTIKDSHMRLTEAFKQVIALSQADHKFIHEQTLDARIHNMNLIGKTEDFLTPVKQWISRKLS